jgi:hypothetical protein
MADRNIGIEGACDIPFRRPRTFVLHQISHLFYFHRLTSNSLPTLARPEWTIMEQRRVRHAYARCRRQHLKVSNRQCAPHVSGRNTKPSSLV